MAIINSQIFYTFIMFVGFGYYLYQLKKLCLYVEQSYPKEWSQLCRNTLGEKSWKGAAINLRESIKTGYLVSIADEKVAKFKVMEKWVTGILLAFCAYKVLFGLYLAYVD